MIPSHLTQSVSHIRLKFCDSKFPFHLAVNTTGNFIKYNMCNNSASLTCSTFSSENCSLNSADMVNPVLIIPGDTYLVTFDTTPQNIEITIRSNSTIIVQSLNFTVGKYVCLILLINKGVASLFQHCNLF